MNDYYHKYIKYKIKYFDIKYGAGKNKKPVPAQLPPAPVPAPLPPAPVPAPPVPVPPLLAPPVPPVTPAPPSLVQTPPSNFSTSSDIPNSPPSPQLVIAPRSLDKLIENNNELVCLLSSCQSLSDYNITSRKTVKNHLYINFIKKGNSTVFAHFSFHYPQEESSNLRLSDMFEANTFHLKLDNYNGIVFNLVLDEDRLVLQGNMEPTKIKKEITEPNYDEIVKIKNCLEEILNKPKYKNYIINPLVTRLF
jgi:hypothetical protein